MPSPSEVKEAVAYVKKAWKETSDYWVPFIQDQGEKVTPALIIELDKEFFPDATELFERIAAAPTPALGLTASNPCHEEDSGRFCETHGRIHGEEDMPSRVKRLFKSAVDYQTKTDRFERFPYWQINLALVAGSILYHVAPTLSMQPLLKVNTGDHLQRLKIREQIAQRVTKVVLGVEEFKNRGNPEALISYWRDGKGADRIDWGSCGDFTRCMKLVGKYLPEDSGGFCFTGDTEFMTFDGPITFEEAAGTDQLVLTSPKEMSSNSIAANYGGHWVQAPIKSFGEHPVLTVVVERNQIQKTIRATHNHIWLASEEGKSAKRGTINEVETRNLQPGMVLAALLPKSITERSTPSRLGIIAGFTFGDGCKEGNKGCRTSLWGDKDVAMMPYFEGLNGFPIKNENGTLGMRYSGIPGSWKSLPNLDEGVSFLYGWLAGYIAADGTAQKNGSVTLSSSDISHLQYAAGIANRLGIGTRPITVYDRKGFNDYETPLYSLGFVKNTIPADLLLIPEHRARLESGVERTKQTSPIRWRVASVEDHGEAEEVFCAEVPNTHTFALTDYIWVHNCQNRHMEIYGVSNAERDKDDDCPD